MGRRFIIWLWATYATVIPTMHKYRSVFVLMQTFTSQQSLDYIKESVYVVLEYCGKVYTSICTFIQHQLTSLIVFKPPIIIDTLRS